MVTTKRLPRLLAVNNSKQHLLSQVITPLQLVVTSINPIDISNHRRLQMTNIRPMATLQDSIKSRPHPATHLNRNTHTSTRHPLDLPREPPLQTTGSLRLHLQLFSRNTCRGTSKLPTLHRRPTQIVQKRHTCNLRHTRSNKIGHMTRTKLREAIQPLNRLDQHRRRPLHPDHRQSATIRPMSFTCNNDLPPLNLSNKDRRLLSLGRRLPGTHR